MNKKEIEELKQAYKEAVEGKLDTFVLHNQTYVTNFAKYLIEHIEAGGSLPNAVPTEDRLLAKLRNLNSSADLMFTRVKIWGNSFVMYYTIENGEAIPLVLGITDEVYTEVTSNNKPHTSKD